MASGCICIVSGRRGREKLFRCRPLMKIGMEEKMFYW